MQRYCWQLVEELLAETRANAQVPKQARSGRGKQPAGGRGLSASKPAGLPELILQKLPKPAKRARKT
jgi:hypothetical protein